MPTKPYQLPNGARCGYRIGDKVNAMYLSTKGTTLALRRTILAIKQTRPGRVAVIVDLPDDRVSDRQCEYPLDERGLNSYLTWPSE
ncbi:hypothetical protein LI90_4392 (plasmid) [Carbonactinospora thermoautotrophica]|uniref:Uncharacterized protein n=1 Tax=Carbonactinospora thermoautotrophica TaxID=1469144 RepID=A0A132MHT5_9ACTN|nr:hypothetical protein [Carbonactinospora thermoautotrophica]KWW97420.1 hypothetical protein LI90_4392 [Carbonactinospora thermoautotrophica]